MLLTLNEEELTVLSLAIDSYLESIKQELNKSKDKKGDFENSSVYRLVEERVELANKLKTYIDSKIKN